jgi:DNA integrity scanning protein DisA with diadenylate cyclase activity
MFVVQNKNLFSINTDNHNTDTRQRSKSYLPQANFTMYQKGAYYSGIKIFNNLPVEIKNVADKLKKFNVNLKQLLYTYSFYTLEQYLTSHELLTVLQKLLFTLTLVWRLCLVVHCISIH